MTSYLKKIKMGQQQSKSEEQQCELEKVDDSKLRKAIEKVTEKSKPNEKEQRERKCKNEGNSCKTSPGFHETMESNRAEPVSIHSEVSLTKQDLPKIIGDKIEIKRGVQRGKETECKDKSGDSNNSQHAFADENNKRYTFKADKVMHVDENITTDKYEKESMQKAFIEMFENKLTVDRQLTENEIPVSSAITCENSRNDQDDLGFFKRMKKTNDKEAGSCKNTPEYTEKDINELGNTNIHEDTDNKGCFVSQKKCLSLNCDEFGYNTDPTSTVSYKMSYILGNQLEVKKLLCPFTGPTRIDIYVIGVPSTPLLHSSGDQKIIKHILKTPHLKAFHIQDEHFRLATFSLSPNHNGLGEALRLAAEGFFYDIDGRIRCFSCRNTTKSSYLVQHHPGCMRQYHAGSSFSHYGESVPNRILSIRQTSSDFSGLGIRLRCVSRTIRLGSTEQYCSDSHVIDLEEADDEVISLRREQHILNASIQQTNDQSNNVVSLVENSPDPAREAPASRATTSEQNFEVSSVQESVIGVRSVIPGCPQSRLHSNVGQRSIKEDVNRKQALENEEQLINPNCRQLSFMGYLRQKCQYDKNAFIDLLDENGRLAMVHLVNPLDNVRDCFEDRLNYIPVMLEKMPDSDNYKTVKPQLEDWEKSFPQLEKKIKILTGELKRKKSPSYRSLDPRGGRAVDRKASSSNKSDAGRSQSHLGRPSSILQTGRLSTTNTGKQSATGRKSIIGNKGETKMSSKGKGGKGKKK